MRVKVGPFLSHLLWKSFAPNPSLVPLYNSLSSIY